MLSVIIVFFFLIYMICELTKYRRIESFKANAKIYNEPVVYVKFVSILITFILLLINRILPSGVMERSMGFKNSILYFLIVILLGFVSFMDVKKIRNIENTIIRVDENKDLGN